MKIEKFWKFSTEFKIFLKIGGTSETEGKMHQGLREDGRPWMYRLTIGIYRISHYPVLKGPAVTGQNIPPAGIYPGLKRPRLYYTRVHYGLGQFIPLGILWPTPIHTSSGQNIPSCTGVNLSNILGGHEVRTFIGVSGATCTYIIHINWCVFFTVPYISLATIGLAIKRKNCCISSTSGLRANI